MNAGMHSPLQNPYIVATKHFEYLDYHHRGDTYVVWRPEDSK